MTLSPQFLDELRSRTLLSALIGRTTKLQKAGREFRACCPFHNEKSPSFYVNDDKGFYHCFGCSAHGDAIRWMTDQRGLPFMDAVKELVQAAGMEMPAMDPRAAEKAEVAKGMHEACADATVWFTDQLNGIAGSEARAVLEKRGIKPATAKAFALGYSPDSRGKLKDALKDYGDPLLIEAGLLISVDDKTPYDRFRGRLMIPIRDPRGRTVAFGGRIIGDGEPKYLNSPETPLFDKGRTLYNLDKAAPAARKTGRVLVVEGYMDVIALAQAGFEEAVAPLGTALTEAQLERLWRMSEVPILCLDGDSAGQKAAIRAARRALPMLGQGRSLAFATMPIGQDPDDVVRQGGPAAFEALLAHPKKLIDVVYASARSDSQTDTPEGRGKLREDLLTLASSIQETMVQSEYRRALNDLFYEDFGWKRGERRAIGQATIRTGLRGRPELLSSYMRSLLYGLSRFPMVLAATVEIVSTLAVPQESMKPWHEAMVNAIIRKPDLDDDAMRAILAASKLKPQTERDIKYDLRFPWDVEPREAVMTLGGMVEFLHEEQDLETEIARIVDRVQYDLTSEQYLQLDRERSALLARKAALYEFGFQLGGGDRDDETDVS